MKKISDTFFFRNQILRITSLRILLLFVFYSNVLLSQIHNSGNVIVYQEDNTFTSDSLIHDDHSDAVIFVASATVFSSLKDAGNYEVVDINSFDTGITASEKVIAQKENNKPTSNNNVKEHRVKTNITIKCLVSTQPINFSFFSDSGKIACTLISGSDHTIKFLVVFPNNSLKEFKFSENKSTAFLDADCIISNHHLTSLSVRPPPFIT